MKSLFMYKKIKIIKRIMCAVFAIILIANASYVFAASFNNDPNDRATLRTVNYTVYGDTNQNWSNSASGNAGEAIVFAIYYHNTSNEPAIDVRVRFNLFTGTVWASNATAVSGSVNVSIPSSQSMSYIPGTVTWRPNQTVSGSQALPFGQTGNEIFTSNGLRLGDIAPGWSTQGSVVLRFQISNNAPPPPPTPSVSITANPTSISYNTSANINWTSSNVTSCAVSPAGWTGTSGSQSTGNLTNSQTYTVNCSGSYGSVSNSATVNVGQQQQVFPSVTLTASPSVINVGNGSVLNWYSQNANYCIASGGWFGNKSISGSETVTPYASTNYTINCYNNSGQNSSVTTVYVNGQQTITVTTSFNAACAVSPEVARVGQIVAFAAGYAGGIAPYYYSWSQDIFGVGLTRAVTFGTTGIKTARVTITDGAGRTAQGTCSVRVNPAVVVVAPPAPKPKPPVVTAVAETCKCTTEQPVQLIETSNGTNGKDRSFVASLLFNENGNLSGSGLILIWYFIILFTVAFGAWMYYLVSTRKE